MERILDLHIHSRFSRACSPKLTLENIGRVSQEKGVHIVATGDFTFPAWFEEIKTELVEENNSGLFRLKNHPEITTRFILSTELSLVYKDEVRVRRIHIMVQAPSISAVEELNKQLDKRFNIRSDGRPILKLPAPELVKICLAIHPRFLIYPAHIWTPWYAIFGSKSGFNSLKECFGDQTKHIYAYETGLSSDPEMNWRLSALDKLTLLSNSDAHSLPNIGREANVMDLDGYSYDEIYEVIKNKDLNKLKYSIEFYPEEGTYYLDGHRDCNFSCDVAETKKLKGICPKCKKPLVVGVSYRVAELADREIGFKFKGAQGFKKLVELDKIIAEVLGIKSRQSMKVQAYYRKMIGKLGPELEILIKTELNDIEQAFDKRIAEGIRRVREGQLIVEAGYDGVYGKIKIFSEAEQGNQSKLI